MSRTHVEIERLVAALVHLAAELPPDSASPSDLRELRRLLYGLHAILTLHFAQEESSIFSLLSSGDEPAAPEPSPRVPAGAGR